MIKNFLPSAVGDLKKELSPATEMQAIYSSLVARPSSIFGYELGGEPFGCGYEWRSQLE